MKKTLFIILISSIAVLACTENKNEIDKNIDKTKLQIELNHKMIIAIRSNDFKAIDLLLNEGAAIDYKDSIGGFTLLTNAIFYKNIESAKYLVEKGADVNLAAKNGISPLMMAIQNKDLEFVKFLIEKGAEINARDVDDETPLQYAIYMETLEIVKYLIQKKANINDTFISRKKFGDTSEKGVKKTLLQFAKEEGNKEIIDLLIAAGAK
jgi:ankyrin repeat protein